MAQVPALPQSTFVQFDPPEQSREHSAAPLQSSTPQSEPPEQVTSQLMVSTQSIRSQAVPSGHASTH